MGKSWKEKPGKYRHNKDFQKKQKQKHSRLHYTPPQQDGPIDAWWMGNGIEKDEE